LRTDMARMNNSERIQKSSKKRVLKIPRVSNFRDMGGYLTGDGRTVKWGQLYRSGHLADLTPRGLDLLTNLDLSTTIDFRSTYEAQRHPDRVPSDVRTIHLPVMDQANREMSQEIRERIKNNHMEGFSPEHLIIKAYRQFPTEFTPAFKTFIHAVLDAKGKPVLWHCTAGKDRTGYATAILFQILGVDQETIYRDYLLSNQYVKRLNKKTLSAIFVRGFKAYRMIKPLMGVQLDWLKAAFDTLDEEWGSFESYVSDGLSLSPSDVRQLQDDILE